MQRISIKETRDNLAEIIDQVAIGRKTFIITKFGKPKAKIVGFKEDKHPNTKPQQIKALKMAFGMWENRPDLKDSAKWVSDQRDTWAKRHE